MGNQSNYQENKMRDQLEEISEEIQLQEIDVNLQ